MYITFSTTLKHQFSFINWNRIMSKPNSMSTEWPIRDKQNEVPFFPSLHFFDIHVEDDEGWISDLNNLSLFLLLIALVLLLLF